MNYAGTDQTDSSETITSELFESTDSVNVFLLRGLTRESGHWGQPFIDQLKKSIPNARIFLLYLPGSGKYVNDDASFSISKMVDFMRKDVIQIDSTYSGVNIICATSLGGMVATDWTIRYPNDFQGMILINSSFKKICSLDERVQKGVRMDMIKVMFTKTTEDRERLIVSINSNHTEKYDSVAKEWVRVQNDRPMKKRNIFKQAIAGMLYSPDGKKPELPLLIVGSKGDRMVCSTCVQKTHDEFGGTLVWHPDSGHGLPIDEPEWLGEQISNWITTDFSELTASKN